MNNLSQNIESLKLKIYNLVPSVPKHKNTLVKNFKTNPSLYENYITQRKRERKNIVIESTKKIEQHQFILGKQMDVLIQRMDILLASHYYEYVVLDLERVLQEALVLSKDISFRKMDNKLLSYIERIKDILHAYKMSKKTKEQRTSHNIHDAVKNLSLKESPEERLKAEKEKMLFNEQMLKKQQEKRQQQKQQELLRYSLQIDKPKNAIDQDITIEVKQLDFSSEKSRANLQFLHLSSIKLPIKSGMILFLDDEDKIIDKVIFNKKMEKQLSIELEHTILSFDLLDDDSTILQSLRGQTSSIATQNIIFDSISVFLYLARYTDKNNEIIFDTNHTNNLKEMSCISRKHQSSSTIKIDLSKRYSHNIKLLSEDGDFKMVSRGTIVRGFWRNQNFKNSPKKLIWIDPFWRGNKYNKIDTKRYQVE
jgi:hypothetical protein